MSLCCKEDKHKSFRRLRTYTFTMISICLPILYLIERAGKIWQETGSMWKGNLNPNPPLTLLWASLFINPCCTSLGLGFNSPSEKSYCPAINFIKHPTPGSCHHRDWHCYSCPLDNKIRCAWSKIQMIQWQINHIWRIWATLHP